AGIDAPGIDVTPVTYTANVNVGTATADATWAGDANHTGNSGESTFDIAQKRLDVTADFDPTTAANDHFTKTYGDANPTFTARYDGFVLGQTTSVLGGALAFDTPATASSDVGGYAVTPKG